MAFLFLKAILNVEWHKRDSSEPKYSQFAAVTAIQRCLPFTDLKKTKMVHLLFFFWLAFVHFFLVLQSGHEFAGFIIMCLSSFCICCTREFS